VVAGAVGGIPEIVTDGESGLLARPGEHTGFAACVATLLGDPALRLAIGRAGAARVASSFTLTLQADRYLEWYRERLEMAS